MSKKLCWAMAAMVAGSLSGALAALVTDDFEGDTVGSKPTTAQVVRPSSPGTDLYNTVVDSGNNPAGTGKAAHIVDNNASYGAAMEYNFVADAASQLSAVRADFSVAWTGSDTVKDKYMALAFGEYNTSWTLSSTARTFTYGRLYNNGKLLFQSYNGGSSTYSSYIDLTDGLSHTVSVFVNDLDSLSITYIGPDNNNYTLATNSVAYWVDGVEEFTNFMDMDDSTAKGTVGTSENNLGKFGFSSGSSTTGIDYVIDDIEISAIPEPAALSLIGLVSAAMLFIRRQFMI